MNKLRHDQEEAPKQAPRKEGSARLPRAFIALLNGSFLARENVLRNMPFILWCAGLMVLYIAYGHGTERIVRGLHSTDAELKELRSEYITERAQLEKLEQQSQVASRIGALGLKESRVPPVKIPVTDQQRPIAHRP